MERPTLLITGVLLAGLQLYWGAGICQMARHAGLPFPLLALVPFAGLYHLSALAERSYRAHLQKDPAIPFLLLNLVPAVLFVLSYLCLLWSGSPYLVLLLLPSLIFFRMALEVSCLHILDDYAPGAAGELTSSEKHRMAWFGIFWWERDTVPVSVTGPGEYPSGRPKYDKRHQWSHLPPQ